MTIGSDTFQYPEEGTKPGWGEEATDWAVAVTDKLSTLSGPNDINITSVVISTNISTATDIGTGVSALKFSVLVVRSFEATYQVIRDNAGTITTESGNMYGAYNSGTSTWSFSHDHIGDAGMDFDITAAGQIQYYSDATKGAGTIKFKAVTLDV